MWRSTRLELCLVVLLLCGLRPSLEENAKIPKSVTAVKRSCVMVPCKSSPYKDVKWYIYHSTGYPTVYSVNPRDILEQFRGRTSVPGKASEGDCTLRIDNIRQEDNVDVYVYRTRYEGKKTKINVLEPETRISMQRSVKEGKDFQAFCTVRHSCPPSPPQIEWLGLKNISNKLSNTEDANGLWIAQASGIFRASREDHEQTLSCRSSLGGTFVVAVNPVVLNVSYSPKNVSVDFTQQNVVVEGGNIELVCISNSNPTASNYEWHVSPSSVIIQRQENRVTLQSVSRFTSVSCSAFNFVGSGESKLLKLNVTFSPTILPDSFCSYQDENLHCVCVVETNPPADIDWTVNGSHSQFNVTTTHSRLRTVSEITTPPGNVNCTARNPLGESVYQVPVRSRWLNVALMGGAGAAVFIIIVLVAVTTAVCVKKIRRRTNVTTEDFYSNENIQQPARKKAPNQRKARKQPEIYENFCSG